MEEISITDIHGFRLGQAQNKDAATGCSVVICERGAVAGVSIKGGAPGTRETDLLRSENLVERIHAVFLAGGSAFGLDTAGGIMKFLEEKSIGFETLAGKVPIVPGAILYDLSVSQSQIRPDKTMGYQACLNAYRNHNFTLGNAGAGTGASIGKILGGSHAMKGGIGAYAIQIDGLQVGAIAVVNSFGDIFDPTTGKIVAGVHDSDTHHLLKTERIVSERMLERSRSFPAENTSLAVIVTNAAITKAEANKLAEISHDGFARTMRPSHSQVDGDAVFTMSTNEKRVNMISLSSLAANTIEQAVLCAVKSADSAYGLLGYNDLKKEDQKNL
ncbi:P1 family peptidase [Thalassobacillus pellis]|uniref:P1 family peptidase n=1 Tax=Thalassobacillus pellis TaxID=748008 RepID=UPI0019615C03|nr:P1 family peptidase [Thalassobacillus pellis]MBM7552554.1 L-aminopeptidase/D-esterase-like protein [Thalassobacillus pellis]